MFGSFDGEGNGRIGDHLGADGGDGCLGTVVCIGSILSLLDSWLGLYKRVNMR